MDTEYFQTPEFLSIAFHILTFFEVPIHSFGTYCILFRTPDSMRSVKWSMLNLQFWSMSLDFGISLMTSPFVLFPAVAGFPLGILKEFGVSTAAQIYLIVVLFANVGVAVFQIFENRFYILFAENTWWRHCRIALLMFNFLLAFFFFIPPYLYIPDQQYALEYIYKNLLPPLPRYVFDSPVFVLTIDITYTFISVFCVTVIIVIEVLVFMRLLKRNMKKRSKQMTLSQKTMDLQRKFLQALHFQIYMPLLVLIVPLSWIGLSVGLTLYNQAITNICFVVIAFHGMISTLVMLLIHKPYRDVCLGVFCVNSAAKLSKQTSPKFLSRRDSMRTTCI